METLLKAIETAPDATAHPMDTSSTSYRVNDFTTTHDPPSNGTHASAAAPAGPPMQADQLALMLQSLPHPPATPSFVAMNAEWTIHVHDARRNEHRDVHFNRLMSLTAKDAFFILAASRVKEGIHVRTTGRNPVNAHIIVHIHEMVSSDDTLLPTWGKWLVDHMQESEAHARKKENLPSSPCSQPQQPQPRAQRQAPHHPQMDSMRDDGPVQPTLPCAPTSQVIRAIVLTDTRRPPRHAMQQLPPPIPRHNQTPAMHTALFHSNDARTPMKRKYESPDMRPEKRGPAAVTSASRHP